MLHFTSKRKNLHHIHKEIMIPSHGNKFSLTTVFADFFKVQRSIFILSNCSF